MTGTESTGVFVVGMHRSGTSVATRVINLLGVPVAEEEELKPPSPTNPSGFWEAPRLTAFNNDLLAELGGSSLAPPPLDSGWAAATGLEQRRARARRLHRKVHPTREWVWKDPRNSVLLPFWREALDARPVIVLVYREPEAVARSLEARQGLSRAMSFAAWERYSREALQAASGLPAFVASYRSLVEQPERWAREVGSFLLEQGLDCDPEGAARPVSELIASGREGAPRAEAPRSAEAAGSRGPLVAPSEAQQQVLAALDAVSGPHQSFAVPELPAETEWVEPLLAERRAADVLRRQMDERLRMLRRRMRAARAAQADADQRLEKALRGRGGPLRAVRRRLPGVRSNDGGGRGALPDFLIIGGQKCGTSSLFRYLGLSSEVVLPAVKEIHFFDLQFEQGVDWYASQFPSTLRRGAFRSSRLLTGEASPYYMFHPLAPQRVREVLPEVRLLALLRDPSQRAVSHYYHEVGNGHETLPLPAALDQEPQRLAGESERIAAEPGYVSFNHRHFSYQARGVYLEQLETWSELFPREQLLVISSDDLFRDPRSQMRRVYEFLGLRGEPPRRYASYNVREYPSVPEEVEARLRERFGEHNARLYRWLGQDLGWPSAQPV